MLIILKLKHQYPSIFISPSFLSTVRHPSFTRPLAILGDPCEPGTAPRAGDTEIKISWIWGLQGLPLSRQGDEFFEGKHFFTWNLRIIELQSQKGPWKSYPYQPAPSLLRPYLSALMCVLRSLHAKLYGMNFPCLLNVWALVKSQFSPNEAGGGITPILPKRKQRHGKVKSQ